MQTCRLFLTALFMIVAVAACKKKESAAEPNRTALLTTKSWKINRITVNNSAVDESAVQSLLGTNALLGQLTASDILFKSDGTFTATNRTSGQKIEGTWSFKENETKLRLDAAGQGYDFTVVLLSDKNLNLTTPYTYNVGAVPITVAAGFELIPS
jgi:hypothetical protein